MVSQDTKQLAEKAIQAMRNGLVYDAVKLFDQCRRQLANPQHLHACAMAYFQVQRSEDALQTLSKLSKKIAPNPQILSLSGDIKKSMGDLRGAKTDYEKAVAVASKVPQLRYNLALCLFEAGDIDNAKKQLEQALHLQSDYGKAKVLLGRCLAANEEYQKSEKLFKETATLEPNNVSAHYRMGRLYVHTGRTDKAHQILDKVIRENPNLYPAAESLLLNSIYDGQINKTQEVIDRLLKQFPHNPNLINLCTDWAIETGQDSPFDMFEQSWQQSPTAQLFEHYQQKLLSTGNDKKSKQLLQDYLTKFGRDIHWEKGKLQLLQHQNIQEESLELIKTSQHKKHHLLYQCLAYLALGQYFKGYQCAQKLQQSAPFDQYYLALMTTALRCLDDVKYHQYVDYQHLVKELSLSADFKSDSSFFDFAQSVCNQLEVLHTMRAAPAQQSVTGGTQTPGNLFARSNHPSIQHLKQAILNTSDSFLTNLENQIHKSHPVSKGRPQKLSMHASWSIRTTSGGFHLPHVHSKGWYSSACYLSVPTTIDRQSDEGYLTFGEPPFKTKDLLSSDHKVRPESGKLVLFPSYFWHATRPFQGQDQRLVVAFDLGKLNPFV